MTSFSAPIRTVMLPSGRPMPVLGQGTWGMGEDAGQKDKEIAALRLGLDLGMTLIDTAEMYGEGGAEEVVGEAIAGRRAEVFLVSKVYPFNASRQGAINACHRSLRRLQTDSLDLYLLHWPGSIPLAETLAAFDALKQAGDIRDYGVSNFNTDEMKDAWEAPGGPAIMTNQVLFNLAQRGIEWDLLPWCREKKRPVMAYSPIEHAPPDQHKLLNHPVLQQLAARHQATPMQIALAWVLHQPGVVAIPKAVLPAHVRANRQALEIILSVEDQSALDQAFPPPHRKQPLAMR